MTDKKMRTTEAQPSSLELTEQLIRNRAFEFYEQRDREHGHDLEDWFRAEAAIAGKKSNDVEAAAKESVKSRAA